MFNKANFFAARSLVTPRRMKRRVGESELILRRASGCVCHPVPVGSCESDMSSDVVEVVPCVDRSPVPCLEDGCPAPELSCAWLAKNDACPLRFSDLWAHLPPGHEALSSLLVKTECPASCGTCTNARGPYTKPEHRIRPRATQWFACNPPAGAAGPAEALPVCPTPSCAPS